MTTRSKVYIPQEPARFDIAKGAAVRNMDLTPALEYGELVICLPHNANFINIVPMARALREAMSGFGPDDYLLAVGDPIGIALASIIAHRNSGGCFTMLKWDRRMRLYQPVVIDV